MKRYADPHADFRLDLLNEARDYQIQAQNKHEATELDAEELDKILTATDRMITFLENFPLAPIDEVKEEKQFMINICAPLLGSSS